MKLGAFSISLGVKDLAKSKAFYEKLGFSVFAGEAAKHYYILKNEHVLIGIFQGMFEGNMLTFNPGWDQEAIPLEGYDDVREIQRALKRDGVVLDREVEGDDSGPGSIVLRDPDGNVLLFDQHV